MSAEPAWLRAKERIPTTVFEDSDDISRAVAGQIADLITQRQAEGWSVRSPPSCLSPCHNLAGPMHTFLFLPAVQGGDVCWD